jgi:hypothetical protein
MAQDMEFFIPTAVRTSKSYKEELILECGWHFLLSVTANWMTLWQQVMAVMQLEAKIKFY